LYIVERRKMPMKRGIDLDQSVNKKYSTLDNTLYMNFFNGSEEKDKRA
jgi:hypothetical protein